MARVEEDWVEVVERMSVEEAEVDWLEREVLLPEGASVGRGSTMFSCST